MITRKEHMAKPFTTKAEATANHRAYYAQFVGEGLKRAVQSRIGIGRLMASSDPALNDIPLAEWDGLAHVYAQGMDARLREAGDYWTLAGGVCILKEAASQLIEEAKANG